MLKMCNMAQIRCQAGFYEEIIAVFIHEKSLKLTPKMTKKNKKFPIFIVLCNLTKVSIDDVD